MKDIIKMDKSTLGLIHQGHKVNQSAKKVIEQADKIINELQQQVKELEEALFTEIEKYCNYKFFVDGNNECQHRRKLISGLGGCLCKQENCFKIQQALAKEKE